MNITQEIKGCDISHWQGNVSVEKLKANNIRFVIAKAGEVWVNTEGKPAMADHIHDATIELAKAIGLPCGDYYYYHPSISASKQAAHYAEIYNRTRPDMPPIIDIEDNDKLGSAEVKRQLFAFIAELKTRTGRTPVVYSTNSFLVSKVGNPMWPADVKFWIARYAKSIGDPSIRIYSNIIMWQFTDKMNVPGVGLIDGNYWNGTEESFKAFVTNTSVPLPPPPVDPTVPAQKIGTVVVDTLTIRVGPAVNAKALGYLRKGFEFHFTDVENERWARIDNSGSVYVALYGAAGTFVEVKNG